MQMLKIKTLSLKIIQMKLKNSKLTPVLFMYLETDLADFKQFPGISLLL